MGMIQQSPGRAPFRTALWATAFILAGLASHAGEPYLLVGTGLGNLRYPPRQAYLSLEFTYALDAKPWGFWTAAEVGPHEGYVGVGLYLQWAFARRWVVGISSGPGWFSDSGPIYLGSNLEFRSTAYLMYRLERGYRIGASLSHYSNAGLATHNPGAESLRVFIAIPLGRHAGPG